MNFALMSGGPSGSESLMSVGLAHSARRRHAAQLLARRYSQRGYALAVPLSEEPEPALATFAAEVEGRTIGTLSVRFDRSLDGGKGLAADTLFKTEVDALRRSGGGLCEFTRLALETNEQPSKRVLARLFHTAYVHAHHRQGAQQMVIEVNPRHVAFYRRMLGLRVCSEPRFNASVQAMAVLMTLDFDHVRAQIARYGGQPAMASVARTLYPYSLSPGQEAELA